MFRALDTALCCAVLFPILLLSQRPPMPGKLVITSTPKGAAIFVDGQRSNYATPRTFVVSPSSHTVWVAGDEVKQCGQGNPARVQVTAGSTWTVDCGKTGWKVEQAQ